MTTLTPQQAASILEILQRSDEHEVWADLAAFAGCVVNRRTTGKFEFGHVDTTDYSNADQFEHPDATDG